MAGGERGDWEKIGIGSWGGRVWPFFGYVFGRPSVALSYQRQNTARTGGNPVEKRVFIQWCTNAGFSSYAHPSPK